MSRMETKPRSTTSWNATYSSMCQIVWAIVISWIKPRRERKMSVSISKVKKPNVCQAKKTTLNTISMPNKGNLQLHHLTLNELDYLNPISTGFLSVPELRHDLVELFVRLSLIRSRRFFWRRWQIYFYRRRFVCSRKRWFPIDCLPLRL